MRWGQLSIGVVLAALMTISCSQGIVAERAFGPAVSVSASPHPVEIHQPKTLGALDTTLKDHADTPVGVSCTTCHGRAGKAELLLPDAPKNFHQGLKVVHGGLSCNSCHSKDRSRLHLADGTDLEFDQTMTLCAQCHGVQHRDYKNGSHGGMSGHWDLQRGGRQRNHCVDCHSPHQPAITPVWPVHPPKDRFLDWPKEGAPAHD